MQNFSFTEDVIFLKTYSTGEICQLCNVSLKQLRYYEEKGLLGDVPRQSGNNYRYYTSEHVYEIVAAKALRNIDMSLGEMKDIVYGKNVNAIEHSLAQQLSSAKEALELSVRQYEQSATVYARLAEALSFLKYHSRAGEDTAVEIAEYPEQAVVALSYEATFEDDDLFLDVEHLPKIQAIAQEVNAVSIGSLLYTTYDHFDSASCSFDGREHPFKIAIPVADQKRPSAYYDVIPAIRGVSTIHVGSPKEKNLYRSYVKLLTWAGEHGYRLQNNSLEEWLISPMITNNKDLWVIRITIPFA